jgi:hypothetical protein
MAKTYHKISNAYDAWWFLYYHPKLQRMIRNEITPKEANKMEKQGFLISRDKCGKCYHYMRHLTVPAIVENLSIHYTKTDGRKVTDDPKKNVNVECWLEFGSVEYGYLYGQPNEDWDDTTGEMNYHDWKLDCGGQTFDAALVQLAKNVRKHYGDYEPKAGRKGKCGSKPCADCAKTKACMKRLGLDKKKKPVVL